MIGGGGHEVNFYDVISLENLLAAWREFKRGKTGRLDVAQFAFNLEDNLFALRSALADGSWRPDSYISFNVIDPKLRRVHKASVRDRVLHQALFRKLYPVFDKTFIHASYSSRKGKGTHAGVSRLEDFIRKASANYTKQLFALKCDVRKFFDSISHSILLEIIAKYISDFDIIRLIERIIISFETTSGRGLPLGNVTSQLFANVYLNDLDQYTKRVLKVRYYIRYCDDFVILAETRRELQEIIPALHLFLKSQLRLTLHSGKISIRKVKQGVDFLGYVVLPNYRVLRTQTKKRIMASFMRQTIAAKTEAEKEFLKIISYSYKGILIHCRGYHIWRQLDTMADYCSEN